MFLRRIAALFLFAALLTGCAPATLPPTSSPRPTAVASRTPAMRATAFPTITPPATAMPLPSFTIPATTSPTPTPDPALAEVRLLGVSWQENYDLLLSIEFPTPVEASAYQVMVEDKWYECQVLPQVLNRLYCIGQGMRVYDRVTVQIFPQGSDVAGFVGTISIPYFPP